MMLPIATALPTSGVRSYGYQRSATHSHNGVDLPAPKGTPVKAAAAGIVEHASSVWRQGFTGYGRHVVVRHDDGTWALYAHLDSVATVVGARVEEGGPVGTVGNSVFSKDDHDKESGGAHLHFEVAARPYPMPSAASRLDPLAWLSGGKSNSDALAAAGSVGVVGVLALAGTALLFARAKRRG